VLTVLPAVVARPVQSIDCDAPGSFLPFSPSPSSLSQSLQKIVKLFISIFLSLQEIIKLLVSILFDQVDHALHSRVSNHHFSP
jgi:hypothetical protein